MNVPGQESTFPSRRYRLHLGRTTITLIRNPDVFFGVRRFRNGHADMGIPHVGVITVLYRMRCAGRRFGLERVR